MIGAAREGFLMGLSAGGGWMGIALRKRVGNVMTRFIAVSIAVWLVVPCSAKTILVDDDGPADYKVIQEALNGSWQGDVIVVKPGTARGRLTFNGKAGAVCR